jgi:hypothetical protein
MRLIGSWGRRSLIVGFGRNDGRMAGRMGDVIEEVGQEGTVSCRILYMFMVGMEAV